MDCGCSSPRGSVFMQDNTSVEMTVDMCREQTTQGWGLYPFESHLMMRAITEA